MEIGNKLRDLREARGLTLRGLSAALKKQEISISHAALGKWEIGKGLPSRENLAEICRFYNIEPSWLMFSADAPVKDQELVDSLSSLSQIDQEIIKEIIEILKKHEPRRYLRPLD